MPKVVKIQNSASTNATIATLDDGRLLSFHTLEGIELTRLVEMFDEEEKLNFVATFIDMDSKRPAYQAAVQTELAASSDWVDVTPLTA